MQKSQIEETTSFRDLLLIIISILRKKETLRPNQSCTNLQSLIKKKNDKKHWKNIRRPIFSTLE